jgi:hypothetical protein
VTSGVEVRKELLQLFIACIGLENAVPRHNGSHVRRQKIEQVT